KLNDRGVTTVEEVGVGCGGAAAIRNRDALPGAASVRRIAGRNVANRRKLAVGVEGRAEGLHATDGRSVVYNRRAVVVERVRVGERASLDDAQVLVARVVLVRRAVEVESVAGRIVLEQFWIAGHARRVRVERCRGEPI